MADAIKHVSRSKRSHNNSKNFKQFAWNAYRKAEERAKVKFGEMLAEEMKKDREKNAEEA